jgi:penicillin-binding protein 1B
MVDFEPELLSGFFNQTWEERDLVQLSQVPSHLTDAIITIEDSRFYEHGGLDLRSILRAFLANLKEGEVVQGGSTLTQQLVKNFFLTQDRTWSRKLNEALMAYILEAKYSKNEILEAYLNEIYMGQQGNMSIHGIGKAAQFFFGKEVGNLTLEESALLAGLIKSPNSLSPYHNPERAEKRRNWVLLKMMEQGKIQEASYQKALNRKTTPRGFVGSFHQAPYFIDFVKQQLQEYYPPEILHSDGLRIFTTLDTDIQREAEASLQKGLKNLEEDFPSLKRENPLDQIQGSLVVVQPQTGYVKAMVGGRNYSVSQFNRVTQAKRQPGSLFKPFVYLTGISQNRSGMKDSITGATLVEDTPISIPVVEKGQKKEWAPENYDHTFHGSVTLRTALESSLNAATVRLAQTVGINEITKTATAIGISSPLDQVPSLALGTSEVSPLEMATAYTTLANQGIKTTLLSIKQVLDKGGKILQNREIQVEKVITPQNAYLMTYLLQGVVEHGTASGVRALGYKGPVAAKTGTTSDYRDAWFVGYTPELLGLVWVGFDRNDSTYLTGSRAALPIWVDLMKRISSGVNPDFLSPSNIIFRKIDPKTGLLTSFQCPDGVQEAFVEGTEPKNRCGEGKKGIMDWFRNLWNP